jgi:hypothetical protein
LSWLANLVHHLIVVLRCWDWMLTSAQGGRLEFTKFVAVGELGQWPAPDELH